jgi:hypothetical protein
MTQIVPRRALGKFLVIFAVIAASTLSAASGASAGRLDPPGHNEGVHHCVNSFGVDYNELFGITEQLRTFECRDISAGERWVPFLSWITDDALDNVYPVGYVPLRPAPMDDFVAKLESVKVVLDGGTPAERVLVFDPSEIVRTDINAEQVNPGAWGFPFPMASILPLMPPVGVGDHTFEPIIVLTAPHCDGFGADPELQCLPAGEVSFFPRPLTILTPEH